MSSAKASSTPMSMSCSLSSYDSDPIDDVKSYRTIVGKLQYLLFTRSDIAFVVNKFSQFTACPTENHWQGLKHTLRFLAGTPKNGLFFHRQSPPIFHAFSDADWGRHSYIYGRLCLLY